MNFKSSPLPYTMGNTGDLIKHGLLCEAISWLLERSEASVNFFDPFGGRPWQSPIHPEVVNRLNKLSPCPLKLAQKDVNLRYFGSGHVVKNLSDLSPKECCVYVSDREKTVRDDLKLSGLNLISFDKFTPDSAYSILDCEDIKRNNSLALIDPFYELEYINNSVLPKICDLVSSHSVAVILYVLWLDDERELWENFQTLNDKLIQNKVHHCSLECQAINDSPVKGEGKYHSSVHLYLNASIPEQQLSVLRKSLQNYSRNLEKALGQPITFSHVFCV